MILDRCKGLCLSGIALALLSCAHAPAGAPSAAPSGHIVVVATTSTLASLVRAVAGDAATVQALVPIGVSPETYEPAPRDVVALENASVVFENGAGLETWLARLITTSATHAHVIILSDAVTGANRGESPYRPQATNPHFWLDPNYAELYVARITQALSAADPANANAYHANATAEIARLQQLDLWTRKRIATIPVQQRAMITFHDAWYYFDRRYGLRDIGAIEPSPGREPSAKDLAALIELARVNHVRAIFAEPEFSPRLAKQLADGAGISTVTDLYDDSLGDTPGLSTYEGMMRHNVTTIVQALGS
ncbi:MAG: zinc ABC transporter substrate-binding protein [Candidatus Eremiobacteraeota bacterium]|nr:zinc ABC transporter substrate-binding protein [Candidatus Eremiobacteraeota bacterium]MBV8668393.1 zinc ABC transporter substrate-binding protein [Candidatus Eremiobacteraeota bacterium]